jgi:hypothetical protein
LFAVAMPMFGEPDVILVAVDSINYRDVFPNLQRVADAEQFVDLQLLPQPEFRIECQQQPFTANRIE